MVSGVGIVLGGVCVVGGLGALFFLPKALAGSEVC